MRKQKLICSLSFAFVTLAGACTDGPVAPTPGQLQPTGPGILTGEYECIVDVASGTTRCGAVPLAGDGPRLALSLGAGPLTFNSSWVHSRGSTVDEDTSTNSLSFTSNIGQPIGTTDGEFAHPDGNRLVFTTPPYVASVNWGTVSGASIRLEGADGTGTFTDGTGAVVTNRPYYQYNGLIAKGATSTSRSIRYVYSSNVRSFGYRYRVWAPVQYEHGWITVFRQGETFLGGTGTFTGTVYDALGAVVNEGITWSTSNEMRVWVESATGQYFVNGYVGEATITATSIVNPLRTGEDYFSW
jgi:hypothetical protein